MFGQEQLDTFQYNPAKAYILYLQDGSQLKGHILRKDSVLILRISSTQRSTVPIQKISRIKEISTHRKNWSPNPHATRYLLAPSAFTLKQGEGYYQNTYALLNSINVGLTDNLSIGGGFEIISLVASKAHPLLFVTSKVGFKVSDMIHVGGGGLYASIPHILSIDRHDLRSDLKVLYGIGTYGTTEHNITAGLGWMSSNDEDKLTITLSGMTHLTENTAILTENWIIPTDDYYPVFSYGIRFLNEKVSLDIAFINNEDIASDYLVGFPYISLAIRL